VNDLYQVKCEGMIPAERCVLLFWPSMQDRERAVGQVPTQVVRIPAVVMHTLEQHGVDEVECRWEGVLQMEERIVLGAPTGTTELHGECPRCGNDIILDND